MPHATCGVLPTMRRSLTLPLALLALLPRIALACTPARGVDVAAFYARIERPPYLLWSVSVAAAVTWMLSRRRAAASPRWTTTLVALALLQPAWWIPNMGDCGILRDGAALLVACVSLLALAGAYLQARRRARRATAE